MIPNNCHIILLYIPTLHSPILSCQISRIISTKWNHKKGAQLGLVPLFLSFRLSSFCSVLLASVYVCVFQPVTKTPVMATTSGSDALRGFTPSLFIVVAHRGGPTSLGRFPSPIRTGTGTFSYLLQFSINCFTVDHLMSSLFKLYRSQSNTKPMPARLQLAPSFCFFSSDCYSQLDHVSFLAKLLLLPFPLQNYL